jgi:hypothetical protein
LFVYYNARLRAGEQDKKDVGSRIQFAMDSLGNFGICSEATWPFEPELITQQPNREAYKEASDLRVKSRQFVPVELDAWKRCLAEGKPIVFGCVLFDTFDNCTDHGGVVRMPDPKDVQRASHGAHAMCCVGYSDVDQVFIVRNSWGTDWGDKGYCYMPYHYLMNPNFNLGDSWVFVPDGELDLPVNIWSDDDRHVVNGGHGVKFPINAFSITAYSALAVGFFESFYVSDYISEVYEEYTSLSESSESETWDQFEDFSYEDIESSEETEEETEEEDDSEDEEEDDSEDEEEDDSEDEEEDDSEDEEEDDSEDEEEDDSEDEEEDDSEDEAEDDAEDEAEDDAEDEAEDDAEDEAEEEEDDSEDEGDDDEGGDDE